MKYILVIIASVGVGVTLYSFDVQQFHVGFFTACTYFWVGFSFGLFDKKEKI